MRHARAVLEELVRHVNALCLPLSCVDISFAAEQLGMVRVNKKLMSSHDKAIVGTLVLKRKECLELSKSSTSGRGPTPKPSAGT